MDFIEVDDIKFKYEKKDISYDYYEIYQHFMNYNDMICYITDKNALVGIISIGDFYRYYNGESKSIINLKFRYVKDIDFLDEKQIFANMSNIHELPVINNGEFIGIIKDGYELDDKEWDTHRQCMTNKYFSQKKWEDDKKENILHKLKCSNIYLYSHPKFSDISNALSDSDIKLFYEKNTKYENGNIKSMSLEEKQWFYGELYSEEFMDIFDKDYHKLELNVSNGICKINNISSKNFNIKDGYRLFTHNHKRKNKKIFIFGACDATGPYVPDNQTVAFYLQQLLANNCCDDYEVINCGVIGREYVFSRVVNEKICEDDIVILMSDFTDDLIKRLPNKYYKGTLSNVYLNLKNPIHNIYNSLAHCNGIVNQEIAKKIYSDIEKNLNTCETIQDRVALQDYYIGWDVVVYYRKYFRKNNLYINNNREKIGAIVMNCNPFTNGHKYLICECAKKVDLLYVFVVEEDKSEFSFTDRIEMVRRGTAEFKNIKVLPSGKYIISKETFAQYFEKDTVSEVNNMDYDVRIFGEVVAKELNISVRFVGEEPFDKVTREYNETMKRILPLYDIEVVEIPRLCTDKNEVISASKVRKAIKENNIALLNKMLPDTTMNYLNILNA